MRNRTPRKTKKQLGKMLIIYDRAVLPINLSMLDVLNRFKDHKVLEWDSSAAGNVSCMNIMSRPVIMNYRKGFQIKNNSLQNL